MSRKRIHSYFHLLMADHIFIGGIYEEADSLK